MNLTPYFWRRFAERCAKYRRPGERGCDGQDAGGSGRQRASTAVVSARTEQWRQRQFAPSGS